MSKQKTTTECIETICEQGCTVVRDVIVNLEEHTQVKELNHLSNEQKKTVLFELKSVMLVYDFNSDSTDESE